MSYKVCKIVDFCYGHRLLNYEGKCKYLHGHNATAELEFESTWLDSRGMVYDFTEIKTLSSSIRETLDHRLILNQDDPLCAVLTSAKETFITMKGNPTAENIAKMIYEHLQATGLQIVSVKVWETPDSSATYTEKGE